MFLSLRTVGPHAPDLSHLLGKHPDRVQAFDLGWGTAHVLYPEVAPEACEVALHVEVDPAALAKQGKKRKGDPGAGPFVDARRWAASSLLSVAIARVFRSAMAGVSRDRPAVAERALPLEARVAAVRTAGAEALFAPLGYAVRIEGDGRHRALTIAGEVRLGDLLTHLYVLVPVLDDDKHYFVGLDEVEKLVRRGEGWLATHPARDRIAAAYLRRQRTLARAAVDRLRELEGRADTETEPVEATLERPARLADRRREAVIEALASRGAKRVLDLGCGDGSLVRALADDGRFDVVHGADVSAVQIERATERLARRPTRAEVELFQASAVYLDSRFSRYDAIALVEVVEHVDPPRLDALCRVMLGAAAPSTVVVTTPNREANVRMPGLAPGATRHRDHRFEWSRAELRAWAESAAEEHGYAFTITGIGEEDAEVGAPTQMVVFARAASGSATESASETESESESETETESESASESGTASESGAELVTQTGSAPERAAFARQGGAS